MKKLHASIKTLTRTSTAMPGRTHTLHCLDDIIRRAQYRMPRMMYDFVAGATGQETGKQLNQRALAQLRLQPRVLVNVEQRSLSHELLGQLHNLPFGIAPMGMCNLAWPNTDRMLARLSVKHNIPLCLSSAASTSIEDMAEMTEGKAWFQLYVYTSKNQQSAFTLVDRAQQAGYQTLVLTVDVPQVSQRVRDLRNGLSFPFKMGPKQLLDFALHPHWSLSTLQAGTPRTENFLDAAGNNVFDRHASRGGCDWEFLVALRARWQGKLIVKGVLHAEDALGIKNTGADAIYISNHGGRQLDSAPPAIMALPEIRRAVGTDFPLIFDSGIRSGEDIVKALALGADFAMLGRPWLYAVGAAGQAGAERLTDILVQEIDVVMAQLGLRQIADINKKAIADIQIGNWQGNQHTASKHITSH